MKRISLPLCLQASALALPLAFLVAGGCGGGNGVTIPPPVVLGTPTPTPTGGVVTPTPTALPTATPSETATPIPIPTVTGTPIPDGTPTPTPTAGYTPNLNFTTSGVIRAPLANGQSLLSQTNRGPVSRLVIITDQSATFTQGQTFNATGSAIFSDGSTSAGVSYVEGTGFWDATGGTITLSLYTPGIVGTGQPGQLQFQLSNVQMVPTLFPGNTAVGTFVLNGTFTATSGRT